MLKLLSKLFVLQRVNILILVLVFSSLLHAQHLYYSDGSVFPLSISGNHIIVKFNSNVSASRKTTFLKNLTEIDQTKEKRGLPNNLII